MTGPLLEVDNLHSHLHTESGVVRAVDGLSFSVQRGETVCLVGESGSGKSLTCDTITGLVGPPAETSGSIRFNGRELLGLNDGQLRSVRGDHIAYVFQNAQNALDPVYTVGEQLIEAITFHADIDGKSARERAVSLLRTVGLSGAEERVDQYPHELSDGMCQRVAIAIGLAAEPDLLIADEPTSALDVMIQARIVELLDDLRRTRELSMLLVTHDLRVAAALGDRLVVMYGGTGVERGTVANIFERPAHPYTQELLRSFTDGAAEGTSVTDVPYRGCRFHRECPLVLDSCREERPPFEPVAGNPDHRAACIYHAEERDPTPVFDRIPEAGIDDQLTIDPRHGDGGDRMERESDG